MQKILIHYPKWKDERKSTSQKYTSDIEHSFWKVLLFQNNNKGLITFTNDGAVCCVSANLSEVDCRRRVLDFKVLKPRDCMKTEWNGITFSFHFKFSQWKCLLRTKTLTLVISKYSADSTVSYKWMFLIINITKKDKSEYIKQI